MTNLFLSVSRVCSPMDKSDRACCVEQLIKTALQGASGNLCADPEVAQVTQKGRTGARQALLEIGLPMPEAISFDILFAGGHAILVYSRGCLVQIDCLGTWRFECGTTQKRTILFLPGQAALARQLISGTAPGSYILPEDID